MPIKYHQDIRIEVPQWSPSARRGYGFAPPATPWKAPEGPSPLDALTLALSQFVPTLTQFFDHQRERADAAQQAKAPVALDPFYVSLAKEHEEFLRRLQENTLRRLSITDQLLSSPENPLKFLHTGE